MNTKKARGETCSARKLMLKKLHHSPRFPKKKRKVRNRERRVDKNKRAEIVA